MSKILITGGAGFIGSSLADELVKDPKNEVVLVDNLITGKMSNLPNRMYANWKFISADVNNYDEILAVMVSTNFDYVFHYAALVGVKRTLDNPTMVLDDIKGLRNILELSKNTGVKRIFYASSSEVYGESTSYPQHEVSTPLNSRLPYAVVKNIGECFCRAYQQSHDLEYTIFRFFNTYGVKQSSDFVVAKFIRQALAGKPLTVFGDGTQSRTFCYIGDNVEATIKAMHSLDCVNETVNLGNEHEYSMMELAHKVVEITGSKSEIVLGPARDDGEMQRRQPYLAKMKELLKREPILLEEGLKKLLVEVK